MNYLFIYLISVAGVIGGILGVHLIINKKVLKRSLNVKGLLLGLTIITGFSLYLFGYVQLSSPEKLVDYIKTVIRALFSTGRMFFLNEDYGVITANAHEGSALFSGWFLIPFWLCHIMALTMVALAAISVFGKKLRSMLRNLISLNKQRYIIFGVNAKSLCFAQNIMPPKSGRSEYNKGRIVIFIDEDVDSQNREKIYRMGGILIDEPIFCGNTINKNALNGAGFSKHELHKGIYVFAFTESDVTNSIISHGVLGFAKVLNISTEEFGGMFVYSDSSTVIDDLEAKTADLEYNINYFCEEDLAARKLFEAKPLFKCLEFNENNGLPKAKPGMDKASITIMILGFGATGKHILRQSLINGQFQGSEFRALVFDNSMGSMEGEFQNRCPGLFDMENKKSIENIHITFLEDDIGSTGFYEKLNNYFVKTNKGMICTVDYIVSCLGDDNINLEIMSDIKRLMIRKNVKAMPVLAAHIADKKYQLFNGEEEEISKITIFGDYDDIFNYDDIVMKEMDRMAMAVHNFYKGSKKWEELSNHLKNSNRAMASFIQAYLYMLGFELKDSGENFIQSEAEFHRLFAGSIHKDLLNNIGATEHMRWNAFHFASGWVKQPLEEITGYESRKDEVAKKQACLVNWDSLKTVKKKILQEEEKVKGKSELKEIKKLCNFQSIDLNNVFSIYGIIEKFNDSLSQNEEEKKLHIARRDKV